MVQVLSRDGIQRMVRKGGGSAAAGGAGGGGGLASVAMAQLTDVELGDTISDMDALVYSGSLSKWTNVSIADMATKTWVGQNYLSIAFFRRLFKAYNGTGSSATEVTPNDTTSTIDNIKAMFGFWTEAYITALGSGGSIGSTVYLSQLADVALSNPTDGQSLVYDATTGKWKNGTVSSGVDMSTVWSALAAATNEQVNYSHLSGAVAFGTAGSDYVPITIGSTTKNVLTSHQSLSEYLQKSGGTMTGTLSLTTGIGIEDSSGNGLLVYHPTTWTGVSSSQWGVGAVNSQGVIRSNDSALVHYRANTAYEVIDSKGGQTISNSLQVASVEIGHTNEINATENSNLYLQYRNTGNLVLCYNGKNVGIGNVTSPSHKLHVDGGIYATSYVTALSDIRKKDVVSDFELRVADIAGASLIKFTWKDKHDTDVHAGGIAQEWKKLLPEAVREDADGTLSMDYGAIAVAASISLARKVVAQERVINAQGKKIASLEKRLARLERMFAINANDVEE